MKKIFTNITYNDNEYTVAYKYRPRSQNIIIFLHGLGCCLESFNYAWTNNKLNKYSLLSLDFVGYGHSSKPEDFTYTMEDQAMICKILIKRFQEQRRHIVVHSMGSAIGLLLSNDLLDSIISFSNIEGNLIAADCDLVSRKTAKTPIKQFKRKFILKQNSESNKNQYFDLRKTTATAFYKSCESLVAWSDQGNLIKKFNLLNCKKTYFYGDQNSYMKIISHLKNLSDIELVEIKNSGHFVMNDNPTDFYSALGKIIDNE